MGYSFCKNDRKQFPNHYEYCPQCGKPLIHIPDMLPSEIRVLDGDGNVIKSNLDEWHELMDLENRLKTFVTIKDDRELREALIDFQGAVDQFGLWWKSSGSSG